MLSLFKTFLAGHRSLILIRGWFRWENNPKFKASLDCSKTCFQTRNRLFSAPSIQSLILAEILENTIDVAVHEGLKTDLQVSVLHNQPSAGGSRSLQPPLPVGVAQQNLSADSSWVV